MTSDPSSLDRLHDLTPPPEVPWWPMAPGWYVVLGISTIAILFVLRRIWIQWQADAYRRAAMRELESLNDATAIAELLRRTALAIAPRSDIANTTGPKWTAWLSEHCPVDMPASVDQLLSRGIYSPPSGDDSLQPLREYASHWISSHQIVQPSSSSSNPS